VRLSYLFRGLPGHPLHPPLTDVAIGTYTFATIAAVLATFDVAVPGTIDAWWIALIVGIVASVLAAVTGVVDWLRLPWGSAIWRTATLHGIANLVATALFVLAAVTGHSAYVDEEMNAIGLLLTLLGVGALTVGGWLGGAIVFVHGMRVLALEEEPTARAVSPAPHPEKEMAEGS
jgi:uncharacterized membrane protein